MRWLLILLASIAFAQVPGEVHFKSYNLLPGRCSPGDFGLLLSESMADNLYSCSSQGIGWQKIRVIVVGQGLPDNATCSGVADVGKVWARKDAGAVSSTFYGCANVSTGSYAWEFLGGGGSGGSGDLVSTGSYSNPAWIMTLAFAKITGVPSFEPANANIQAHIASTTNPHAVTAAQVGLGSANNTSDAAKPISTAETAALALKAPLASPVFSTPVTVGTTILDPVTGINDPIPPLLPKWRLAVSNQQNGVKDAKLLLIGDSTTSGAHATNLATTSYYARLAAALPNAAIGLTLQPGDPDPRWVVSGTAWTNFAGGFASRTGSLSGSGTMTFTPGGTTVYDSFDVYIIGGGAGSGTFTMTATGGTPVVVNAGNTSLGPVGVYHITVAAAAAATTNSVVISASPPAFLLGVEPFLSTTRRIRVADAGSSGSTSSQWATRLTGINLSYDSIATITAYAPDLTIIDLGINDAGGGISTATLAANLTAVITAAQLSGDVIIKTMVPSLGSPRDAVETSYQATFKGLAQSLGLPLIDTFARFGGVYPAAAFMFDTVHPNDIGYADIASQVAAFLQKVRSGVAVGTGSATDVTESFVAGTGGVTANTFVTMDITTAGQVIATTTSNTTWYGVALSTASAGGTVLVRRLGSVQVLLDNGTATTGNAVILSSTVAGNAHDSGGSRNLISILNSTATFRSSCASACSGTLVTIEITPADRGTALPGGVTIDPATGNISTPGSVSSGVGSGVATVMDFLQGTAPPAQAANTFRLRAPASIPTAFSWTVPSADAAGAIVSDGAGNLSLVGSTGTGNFVRATGPTLTTPVLGAATGTSLTLSGQAQSASLKVTGISGSTQCLHVDTTGAVSGMGSDCGTVGGSVTTVTVAAPLTVTNPTTTPALAIAANGIGSGLLAVVNTRKTICIPIGGKNAAAVFADTDLADSDLYPVNGAATLIEVTVRADAGTPQIILGRDRSGTVLNLTSAALATAASGGIACSNAGGTTSVFGTTTCSATLQNTALNLGDWIVPVSGTAGGVAKQMSVCATWTVN